MLKRSITSIFESLRLLLSSVFSHVTKDPRNCCNPVQTETSANPNICPGHLIPRIEIQEILLAHAKVARINMTQVCYCHDHQIPPGNSSVAKEAADNG